MTGVDSERRRVLKLDDGARGPEQGCVVTCGERAGMAHGMVY